MSGAGRVPFTIDAHHHLWHYSAVEYDWIDSNMAVLQRDFTAADLAGAMLSADVQRTVAVQARQSLAETDELLAIARGTAEIAGVVGWLPLADATALERALTTYAGDPLLVGARHVVQGEPAGFLEGEAFNDGIRTLTGTGLAYELLIRADQLEEATRFVDRHPQQRFVLDHLAKPRIAAGELEPWRSKLKALAERDHVSCKLSGMVTEADWQHWSPESLRPYFHAAVAAFGPARLMAGSDWPVCLVAATYEQWWSTLRHYFAGFTTAERAGIFGGNAAAFYRLAPGRLPQQATQAQHL